MNPVTEFFKTLFKDSPLEKVAYCVIGDVKAISVPLYPVSERPDFTEIQITFVIENSGNLDEIFRKPKKDIMSMLNMSKKKYKLEVALKEVQNERK